MNFLILPLLALYPVIINWSLIEAEYGHQKSQEEASFWAQA